LSCSNLTLTLNTIALTTQSQQLYAINSLPIEILLSCSNLTLTLNTIALTTQSQQLYAINSLPIEILFAKTWRASFSALNKSCVSTSTGAH
uniref:Uncharacterized protein n=1 Tax=Ditylenchus dipsaci TaxID=166011 RepID=A0A915DPP6_9BILA